MRVESELPSKYKPPRDWVGIARQVRQHAGKWVEVDKDSPVSTAWRINNQEGPKVLRDDNEYVYEAAARDITKERRCALWIKAIERGSN